MPFTTELHTPRSSLEKETEGAPKLTAEEIRSVADCSTLTTGYRKQRDASQKFTQGILGTKRGLVLHE